MTTAVFDLAKVRRDFPVLAATTHGRPIVYLDNAATTQKPLAVIERMDRFFRHENANIHRGVYELSERATLHVDQARSRVRHFLNAAKDSEIVFTRGATEAINLVMASYGRKFLKKGDEIVVSSVEHHSNLVPWQALCEEKGLVLKAIPVLDNGELDLDAYQRLLGPRTYFVAITHVSNALGTVHPVKEMIKMAHHAGAAVLVDGAQSAPHRPVDVQDLDCDFFCLSGHKIYGPTGVGVLYGKEKHLLAMDPYQYGGDMIETVTLEKSTYAKPPAKFEAGTPAIAEIIGLGAAIEYLEGIGFEAIQARERELLEYATRRLSEIPSLRIVGTAADKESLVSFTLGSVHPHDVGTVLGEEGVCVRAGHHCAQPVMKRFGVPATTRASFSFYNTKEEVDALVAAVKKVVEIFKS